MNVKLLSLMALAIAGMLFVSCNDDDDMGDTDLNNDVFELAIRKINPGTSISEFTSARDAFVAKLIAEDGTSNDREVQPIFDLAGSGLPLDSIYIGMTQYENFETYNNLGQSLSSIPEASAFLSTFSPIVFEALEPIDGYKPVDLGQVAPEGTGQILEIAVRDLNAYNNFDQEDYESKRDAFIDLLSQQSGFIREIQWQSVLNDNIVVGMTVYESQSAAIAISSNPDFVGNPAVTEFISAYPPTVFGTLNMVLK